jgi:hypothetical protein
VFEIGSSLRDSRMRQKLDVTDVERDTRIRARYLIALEEERFEDLPGSAYAKGFLRTYANYLGLDAQRFIDEYNSRFAPSEELAPLAPARPRRRRSAIDLRLLVIPAAAILALLGWRLATPSSHHETFTPPPPRTQTTTKPKPAPAPPVAKHPAGPAKLKLVASRGRCWVLVRLGSETGRQLFERTLEQGESARFVARRLWIRIGAPWNLDATLNGKPVALPAAIANVIATRRGLAVG